MITSTLQEKIKDSLKDGDAIRASTLRLLLSAFKYEAINKMRDLSEEEELAIVRRQLKQREEAIVAYEKGGRAEAAEKEQQEAQILKEFLPEQMKVEELGKVVDRVIGELGASGMQDFGRVMGETIRKVAGKADGKSVSELVREKLQ